MEDDYNSRCKNVPLGSGYRFLAFGEEIQEGDEAYTWANPECTQLGWIGARSPWPTFVDDGHVPVRRKVY